MIVAARPVDYAEDAKASFQYPIRRLSVRSYQHVGLGVNTLRPRQNGRRFTDDVFKCIFLNENVWISLKISLTCVPKVPINNIPALIQILAWRRSGDKPLSEPMMVSLLTHICVTRPQWVNSLALGRCGLYLEWVSFKLISRIYIS